MPVVLFVAFIIVPILELWLIGEVADVLSWPVTLLILIAEAVLGAWLVKREGRSTWRRFREALGSRARVPAVEVVDGALVLVGGTLLLTPGFLSDIVGFLCLLPPSRAVLNRAIRARMRRSFRLGPARSTPRRVRATDDPIDVQVIEVRRNGDTPGS
jgi:UPF0716 protein FxsA